MDKGYSLSLPQLSLLEAIDDPPDEEDSFLSPLNPKLAPTIRAQNLSPFWLSGPLPPSPHGLGTSSRPWEPLSPRPSTFSLLHAAAITGDKSGLSKLASGNFCDIDLRDKFGRTPLMYSVLANYPECTEVLLKNGSDAALADNSGRTALHWAVYHGHAVCAKVLLGKCRLAWQTCDQGGVTVLHLAMRHQDKKILQLLQKHFTISQGNIDLADANKRTALHWAASHGNHDHVKQLLKLGASVGRVDVEGKTPIHWAAATDKKDSARLVQLLLHAPPRTVVNWTDHEGRLALHLAVAHSNMDVVALLTNTCKVNALDNCLRSALHWAALAGRATACRLLLDRGAKADLLDETGATPVHHATEAGGGEAVRVFVGRGLGRQLDQEGRTPLMWAAARGATAVMEELGGKDIDAIDSTGYTALHIAVSCDKLSSVDCLLRMKADPKVVTKDGLSSLGLAAQLGHSEVGRLLMDCGANIDQVDSNGRTPLHWACQGGHAYLASLLLKAKAGLNRSDQYGRTALMMASFGGFLDTMAVLLDWGVNLNKQDNEGMCALHWAVRRGHADGVKVLLDKGAYPNHIAVLLVDADDSVQITPLDSALMAEQTEIVAAVMESGGFTITRIHNIAATRVQAYFRGYRIRKVFRERRKLFVKHEQLRAKKKKNKHKGKKETKENKENAEDNKKEAKKNDKDEVKHSKKHGLTPEWSGKRGKSKGSIGSEGSTPSPLTRVQRVAGHFLGSMVEEQHKSSYYKRVAPGEDQPLPGSNKSNLKALARSMSVGGQLGDLKEAVEEEDLAAVPLSSVLHKTEEDGRLSSRADSKFSYNLHTNKARPNTAN